MDDTLGIVNQLVIGEVMKKYINSAHQKNGDKFYNKKKFNKALDFYVLGLNYLESEIDKNPKVITSATFHDEYARALSDVLITQGRIIDQFIIDSQSLETNELLNRLSVYSSIVAGIGAKVHNMNKSWDFICNESKTKTKQKHITNTYALLALSLELLSDLWSATADEVERTHPNYESLLSQSCTAMKLAIELKSGPPESAGIDMHCGYLNLLEQLYNFKKDAEFQKALLINIKKHLDEYQLLEVLHNAPITQLELISYALLVDVHLHHTSNTQLIAEGKKIVASITERTDANEKVISDFDNLVAQAVHFHRQGSSSSSSSTISLPVSRMPQQQSRSVPAYSSSSSAEIHQNSVEQHPLSHVAELIARNPDHLKNVVNKLYSIGRDKFIRLYPYSDMTNLVKKKTQSQVERYCNSSFNLLEDTEQFSLLASVLDYIANHYLEQVSNPDDTARRLFETGKPWQQRAILSSLKIQTAIRSTPFRVQSKRTRIDSAPDRILSSPSEFLPETHLASEETNKRLRKLGDSKTPEATNTDQLLHLDSEFLSDESHALDQWNLLKHSYELTLGSNNFVNKNVSLSSQSDTGTFSCLPIELNSRTNIEQPERDTVPSLSLTSDSRTHTAQSIWDDVPPLSLALDSRADTELSILDTVQGPIESVSKGAGFVSNLSMFASSTKNKPNNNGLNESHPKVLAFIHTMNNINFEDLQSRKQKRLLANLLTIMGQFLEEDPKHDAPIKKFDAIVLTVESLYKTALVIYPNHEIASVRIQKLQDKHKTMLEYRHHFVSLSDDIERQSDKMHFGDAIECMITDLEVLYSGKSSSIVSIINSLFKFMTGKILEYRLMNTDDLNDLMDQFHGSGTHLDMCSSSTHSLSFN